MAKIHVYTTLRNYLVTPPAEAANLANLALLLDEEDPILLLQLVDRGVTHEAEATLLLLLLLASEDEFEGEGWCTLVTSQESWPRFCEMPVEHRLGSLLLSSSGSRTEEDVVLDGEEDEVVVLNEGVDGERNMVVD